MVGIFTAMNQLISPRSHILSTDFNFRLLKGISLKASIVLQTYLFNAITLYILPEANGFYSVRDKKGSKSMGEDEIIEDFYTILILRLDLFKGYSVYFPTIRPSEPTLHISHIAKSFLELLTLYI